MPGHYLLVLQVTAFLIEAGRCPVSVSEVHRFLFKDWREQPRNEGRRPRRRQAITHVFKELWKAGYLESVSGDPGDPTDYPCYAVLGPMADRCKEEGTVP